MVGLELVEVPGVHIRHRQCLATGDHQAERLGAVVLEHQLGDLVGHLEEELVALVGGQLASGHHVAEQDLDVDLVVAAIDTGRVVDRVGVDQAIGECVLDAAELREPEVPALGDHPAAQLRTVDPEGVVGAVADVGVGLAARLHVGPDAAVPEQVDRRRQDRPDQLDRGDVLGRRAEHVARLDAQRDRLDGTWVDASAGRDQPRVVVGPRRARQLEQTLALGERVLGGRGRGR